MRSLYQNLYNWSDVDWHLGRSVFALASQNRRRALENDWLPKDWLVRTTCHTHWHIKQQSRQNNGNILTQMGTIHNSSGRIFLESSAGRKLRMAFRTCNTRDYFGERRGFARQPHCIQTQSYGCEGETGIRFACV